MDIKYMTALEMGEKIRKKEIGVAEATKAVLENVKTNE